MKVMKALGLSAVLCTMGCAATPDHLFVAADTSLGVSGNINSTRTSGTVVIGYDRKFVAYVPQTTTADGKKDDVMSAFNCTALTIEGITVTKFYERLATGEAAQTLVKLLPPTGQGSECIYDHP